MFYKIYDNKLKKYVWKENNTEGIIPEVVCTSESVADFSNWSPNLDNVKQLQLALSGNNNSHLYDYADGVDTNSSNYLLRRKDLDITERAAILRSIFNRNQEEAQSNLDLEIEKIKKESSADISSNSQESQSQ